MVLLHIKTNKGLSRFVVCQSACLCFLHNNYYLKNCMSYNFHNLQSLVPDFLQNGKCLQNSKHFWSNVKFYRCWGFEFLKYCTMSIYLEEFKFVNFLQNLKIINFKIIKNVQVRYYVLNYLMMANYLERNMPKSKASR